LVSGKALRDAGSRFRWFIFDECSACATSSVALAPLYIADERGSGAKIVVVTPERAAERDLK
jgi:hypothetical protein